MMSRRECEELVSYPGKFEGEPPYTPYFYYYAAMDNTDVVEVNPYDVKMFPELKNVCAVRIIETNEGFVISKKVFRAEHLSS